MGNEEGRGGEGDTGKGDKGDRGDRGRKPRMASRYFSLLLSRNFSEADEILKSLREKAKTEWEKGYVNAMEGLMVSLRAEGEGLLYAKRIMGNSSSLKNAKSRFMKIAKEPKIVTIPFEDGFAKCWIDFLRILGSQGRKGSVSGHKDAVSHNPRNKPR